MLIKIDFENETPIYEQLRNQIVLGIAKGELLQGESLPSVRQFAADLGINMHTVNKTYSILRAEGFLAVHKRDGVVVRRKEEVTVTDDFLKRCEKDIQPIAAEAICRSVSEIQFIEQCERIYRNIRGGR
jgi:GntR family transcriptional regulator